ncbi:MAG: isoleucine--tRNA ligase [Thermoplasmatales archaeon]|nr:isoleucine--tRNA ligase [Candidatus Thermoplasmatota archaeon]MDA8055194.1 isoleucine--tRNA ligase [Thermoplasmatales archaeon]
MLDEVPQSFDPLQIEKEASEYWERENIMQRSFEVNRGKRRFSFVEGPPTANGPPHIGHAETRAMKDLFLRYKTMRGFDIYPRIAGWDCHGLPVEIEVEKKLGIKNKAEIERMGVSKFNNLCKESVFEYVKVWTETSKRLGFWVDYDKAYITMRDEYIESEWWALKELYKKGLLFKDFRISPYCPRCGTTLSAHEVSQGYKEVEDFSIYAKFKLEGKDEYFLVWTTTPWTLPANEYLVVNPNFNYLLVKYRGEKIWVVEDRAKGVLKKYEVLDSRRGSTFIGTKYQQLIPYLKVNTGLYVVGGDFVTKEDGSGIVHAAPAFGADDYVVLKREKGELYVTVDDAGKISLDSPWKGLDVQTASEKIIEYLKESGQLLKIEKAEHTYPFCWRCDTRLIFYPVDSWYIGVSKVKDRVVEYNQRVNWKPEHVKDGRFGNFLEEGKDWALSRSRFWGTPLPVWICKNNHVFVPGSKQELLDNSTEVPDNFELHRPKVDEIKVECRECGEQMVREPYPIDTWFDSGSAFFAQFHYPFENADLFRENNPVDFISEAIDQTRGWFYSLHVISSLLFDRNAYNNVVVMEFVLNSKGEKMSKSRGDQVDPLVIMDRIGTDSLRLFFFQGPPWKPKRFSEEASSEFSRKLLGTLYNSYLLFSTNARLDHWTPRNEGVVSDLDMWMLSRTNDCISSVTRHMDEYDPHLALDDIKDLVLDLSQWYLRLSRDTFWSGEMSDEKRSSYYVTYNALSSVAKMLAPFAPYFSEYLYRKLTGEPSVHLSGFPEGGESSLSLLEEMKQVKDIVESGRRIRQKNGLILRRPVREIIITEEKYRNVVEKYGQLIKKELNSKELKVAELKSYLRQSYSLNKKATGKIFGKELSDAEKEFETKEKQMEFHISGNVTVLGKVLEKNDIDSKEHLDEKYVSDEVSNYRILIDKEFDKDLYLEGLARDMVRRIQSMRKDANLDYTDRIYLHLEGDESLMEAFTTFKEYILSSTQSEEKVSVNGTEKTWDISGLELRVSIERISA